MTNWQKVILWSVAIVFGLPVAAFIVVFVFLGVIGKALFTGHNL